MMTLLINTYFPILVTIASSAFVVLLLGSYGLGKFIYKKPVAVSPDVTAIAGDNEITTQLDLARAYIEINSMSLAKTILETVMKQGNAIQRQEAKQLLCKVDVS